MVGRDGNLINKIVAVALAPVEDYYKYMWLFSKFLHNGFPLTACPVLSDRNVSLVSDAESLGDLQQFCVRHIIDVAIGKCYAGNPAATIYPSAIPASNWRLHPHANTTSWYGWRTTNFVESEQAKILRRKARKMQPYEIFKSYLTIFMGEAYNRVRLGQLWVNADRKLTPRAEHDVAFIARISNPTKQRRLDLKSLTCSCLTCTQHRIACRHLIATILDYNMVESAYELMDECYTVASYQENPGTLVIPEYDLLTADLSIPPAAYVQQAGRPRKDASDPMVRLAERRGSHTSAPSVG
ncbi:Zinc finger, SWIM-type [Plasmopara halstedii]|uniref:Zinc finger, SWIM-type n=1 Tax=Plasmopara halstedii TaxID=4781 RepID=A0A0P1B145_PLAHL|nr:Zinc finger, SWIM-type [Plasmopara halstedii]CEG47253.1 Zinc finger, SWIM-type [Plasmopara halstedii]|eukprot:XP_024583622.1 Zinc finger, SWIM-type [Plasmopara halstedii]